VGILPNGIFRKAARARYRNPELAESLRCPAVLASRPVKTAVGGLRMGLLKWLSPISPFGAKLLLRGWPYWSQPP
jgi:hypothetical protein